MLTLTLRNLERDGLLTRTVYPTVPPKVEYTATPMALGCTSLWWAWRSGPSVTDRPSPTRG